MSAPETPKLDGMKFLVEQVLHSDDHATVVLIGDQGAYGKRYALKKVRKETPEDEVELERARASFEASAKLNHPAALQYYDYRLRRKWFSVNGAELLMEYVSGKSFEEITKARPSLVFLAFRQVANFLAHASRRGVLHGCLKPSNILLGKNGQVKVLNYGMSLVKLKDPNAPKPDLGWRETMAPEQMKEKTIDEKTDIYAFGATLYKVLTGRSANSGSRMLGEAGKIPTPMAINSAVPVAVSNLVVTCLQSSPDKRPENLYELNETVEKIVKQLRIEDEDIKEMFNT